MFVQQVLKEASVGMSQEALEDTGLNGVFDETVFTILQFHNVNQVFTSFEGNASDSPHNSGVFRLCSVVLYSQKSL